MNPIETKRTPVKISAAHRRALGELFDRVGATPFRRSDLSELLYPITRPRSRGTADTLADALLREVARAGEIQRHGHLHWMKVQTQRVLRSGRKVPEHAAMATIALNTRCPGKWAAVDLETGEVWAGTPDGWKRASAPMVGEVLRCVTRS